MKTAVVTNIQRYSTHDGDGVRTTIFFKGCPLSCRWCHNPESQDFRKELFFYDNKCKNCGGCIPRCPSGANVLEEGKLCFDRSKCTGCGNCTDWCIYEARELAGKDYTAEQLVKEAKKDRIFYEQSGGGVTLSGGEVMSQDIEILEPLCRGLHREGLSVFIDTCGFAPYEKYEKILPYVDTFLYDIKAMDSAVHKEWTGVDNALILENLKKLSAAGANIYIRIPTIGGVNANEGFMQQVIAFLTENNIHPAQVNLLPYHNYGRNKYASLAKEYDDASMQVPSDEQMEQFKNMFINSGFTKTNIGG
ncbi:MAG: glycyl-radical enzyme activating protein [Oscillospiraceae bacterium]|nr:glycyl-radical enzyme activating protein [Oscillospiraceae bacterium]